MTHWVRLEVHVNQVLLGVEYASESEPKTLMLRERSYKQQKLEMSFFKILIDGLLETLIVFFKRT